MTTDYNIHYFAIVCFKQRYDFKCFEYIFKVGVHTQIENSLNHKNSSGKAFWEYNQIYAKVLGCAPDLN